MKIHAFVPQNYYILIFLSTQWATLSWNRMCKCLLTHVSTSERPERWWSYGTDSWRRPALMPVQWHFLDIAEWSSHLRSGGCVSEERSYGARNNSGSRVCHCFQPFGSTLDQWRKIHSALQCRPLSLLGIWTVNHFENSFQLIKTLPDRDCWTSGFCS